MSRLIRCAPAVRVTRGLQLAVLIPLAATTLLTGPGPAWGEDGSGSRGGCRRSFASLGEGARSKGSLDLYHGIAYFAGAGAVRLAGDPTSRWSGTNGFDDGIQDGLRLSSTSARRAATLASDVTLALSVALPVATMGASYLGTGDCIETWEMLGEMTESFGLTIFLTEAVKLAAGRERPFTERCGPNRPPDASCGSDDRHRSFFSGHASLAAAGAGVGCSFAVRREAWGTSAAAKATPCVLGGALALTTGILRISADRHWGTDVLTGFVIGGVVGYLDPPGPLDLLRFQTRDSGGRVSSTGFVMPGVVEGGFGLRLVAVF